MCIINSLFIFSKQLLWGKGPKWKDQLKLYEVELVCQGKNQYHLKINITLLYIYIEKTVTTTELVPGIQNIFLWSEWNYDNVNLKENLLLL